MINILISVAVMKLLLHLKKFTCKVGIFGVVFQIAPRCTILPHHDFVLNFLLFLSINVASLKNKISDMEGTIF